MLQQIKQFIQWNRNNDNVSYSKITETRGRPKKEDKYIQTRVFLHPETLSWLYNYKKENNVSISKIIRDITEEYKKIIEEKKQ